MNLPKITFLKKPCQLFESDYECNGHLKPYRVMQLMQDAATSHADEINLGWDNMAAHGILWILSKVDVSFVRPITRGISQFNLYTWPLAPNRFYSERQFVAEKDGQPLFYATTLWMLIERRDRKILSAEKMNEFCTSEYDTARNDGVGNFLRVRMDDTFQYAYTKVVRRADMDINGHVNNTNYVTYALDVLAPDEQIKSLQIVYNKELLYGDMVALYVKRENTIVTVVGMRKEDTCFSVVMQLA